MAKSKERRSKPAREPGAGISDRERRQATAEILSPAMPPAGAGAMLDVDPRLNQVSETESAMQRATEPSDTVETQKANQRRKSDDIDGSGS